MRTPNTMKADCYCINALLPWIVSQIVLHSVLSYLKLYTDSVLHCQLSWHQVVRQHIFDSHCLPLLRLPEQHICCFICDLWSTTRSAPGIQSVGRSFSLSKFMNKSPTLRIPKKAYSSHVSSPKTLFPINFLISASHVHQHIIKQYIYLVHSRGALLVWCVSDRYQYAGMDQEWSSASWSPRS